MRDTEGNILQLKYKDKPWKVLVVCILLNRTSRTQVEPVVEELFKQFPTLYHLAHVHEYEGVLQKLVSILKPLGLYNRRAETLIKFANSVLDHGLSPKTVESHLIYGVGNYASDCYMIMYHGQRHLTCEDGALVNYLEKLKREE